ncbi:hypothetical protein PCL_03856 [Purpureocillium lilacinum]|uniref:Uncharacterized protein n=2 Tax=Purpureocillium lilacinum TaxID=33203 RepID=A0A2U3EQ79_PURLI|nr:hypothetical protein Purlil1_3595 [Purpureocillium lilacinum]PWI76662.1 hypothetical protein PCL_03856 [Purpureocillium lilacinum]
MPAEQIQNGFKSPNAGYVRLSEKPGVKQSQVPQTHGAGGSSSSRNRQEENMSRVKEALAGRGSLQFH